LDETSFWEISGFAGSIVALIGNITGYPGSLAALARQHEHASNPFVFGGNQYRGKFQVPDEMMAMEVG
jgi:predicted mannosyl-3-phosphoglycerate phosphatase (HAD superfamily)